MNCILTHRRERLEKGQTMEGRMGKKKEKYIMGEKRKKGKEWEKERVDRIHIRGPGSPRKVENDQSLCTNL